MKKTLVIAIKVVFFVPLFAICLIGTALMVVAKFFEHTSNFIEELADGVCGFPCDIWDILCHVLEGKGKHDRENDSRRMPETSRPADSEES